MENNTMPIHETPTLTYLLVPSGKRRPGQYCMRTLAQSPMRRRSEVTTGIQPAIPNFCSTIAIKYRLRTAVSAVVPTLREREGEREREREREKERETERQRDRETESERERDRQTDRHSFVTVKRRIIPTSSQSPNPLPPNLK